MKFVVIKEMAVGNETVGEMWQETRIYDENTTLSEVMDWAMTEQELRMDKRSKRKIILTLPYNGGENENSKSV